jgi:hypothetical protein
MDSNFNFTTLSISDQYNSIQGFKIGSIYNKNLAIRNITLMRNIGKYKMYNIPMFPEIGMLYNVYEKELNRPVRHYEDGGLLEWNNDIKSFVADPSISDTRSYFLSKPVNETGVTKTFYSTNSGSVGLSGGNGMLKRVREDFNNFLKLSGETHYLPEIYNVGYYKKPDGELSNEKTYATYQQRYKIPSLGFIDVATNEHIDVSDIYEGTYTVYNEKNEGGDSYKKDEREDGTYNKDVVYREGKIESRESSLLNKTNALFENKKIESIIGRYYTEGDKFSRGRNLRKEKDAGGEYGNSFNSPYCRV